MAFCSKCGAQLEDGNTVCPSCGNGKEKAAEQQSAKNNQSGDKNGIKNLIPFIGIAAAVIVVIIILVNVLGGGAKKPIKSLVKTMNNASYELEDYMDSTNRLFSDLVMDAFDLVGDIDKGIKKDLEKAIMDTLEDTYDELEDKYGKNIKITYEIEDEEEIDKEELEVLEEGFATISEVIEDEELSDADELMDMVEDLLGTNHMEDALDDIVTKKNVKKVAKFLKSVEKDFGKASVDAGYVITLDVEIGGKEADDKFKDLTLNVLKINGKWGIEPSSLLEFMDTVIGLDIEDVAEDVAYSILADMME